jgi:hypothetical protein
MIQNMLFTCLLPAAPVHMSPLSDKIYMYMPPEFNVYTPFPKLPNFLAQKPAATTYWVTLV